MFGSIGGPELIVIFVVALLIFGPRKLPELGRMLGKGMAEFRRAANDLRDSLETEVARDQTAQREIKAIAAPNAVLSADSRSVKDTAAAAGTSPASAEPPETSSQATAPSDAAEPPGQP